MLPVISLNRGFSSAKRHLEVLFFGDVVGKSGRAAVYHYLATTTRPKADVVMANVENLTHGFGVSEAHYRDMLSHGFDVLTGGNHIFDRKESAEWMDGADRLVRPYNIPGHLPGTGARVFQLGDVRFGVLNLLGQSFMANYNSPWEYLDEYVPQLLAQTPIIFLDFHAESTAEKNCMGRMAASMGVSAMVGTHTHVQTADDRLLLNRMGYVTDAGFNGARESIIGMEPFSSMNRMRTPIPTKLEVATETLVQINAVQFTIDIATGTCDFVQRIYEVITLPAFQLQKA
jgi:2',3'-cyclic-nucleotide 2'-phosphodiesterase